MVFKKTNMTLWRECFKSLETRFLRLKPGNWQILGYALSNVLFLSEIVLM